MDTTTNLEGTPNGQGSPDAPGAPTGTGAGSGSDSGQAPTPGAPSGLDRSKLNPVIRSMSEVELNEMFETLVNAVRQPPQQPQAPVPEQKAPEPPNYRELLDPNNERFNPQEAFQAFVTQNYGGLLSDINQRSLDAVFLRFRQELPDFAEHENDIREVLKGRDSLRLTQQDILGTYYAVKGAKHTNELIKKRREAAAAGTSTPKPSAPVEPVQEPQLDDLQKEVAFKMFPRAKDPVAEYKRYMKMLDEGTEIKVPIGGGKFA